MALPASKWLSLPVLLAVLVVGAAAFLFLMPKTSHVEFYEERDVLYDEVSSAFLRGDWQQGKALLARNQGKVYKRWQQERLQALVGRVERALGSADEGRKAMAAGEVARGAELMALASREYPESRELRSAADYYEGQVALERKDYPLYLRLAEQNHARDPRHPDTVLWLANALILQYGATGDTAYKERALATLADGQVQNLEALKPGFSAEADAMRRRLSDAGAPNSAAR
jgi:hypothetical protein